MDVLKGFDKSVLESGSSKTLSFVLDYDDLASYDASLGAWVAPEGVYLAKIGFSSRDVRLKVSFEIPSPGPPETVAPPPRTNLGLVFLVAGPLFLTLLVAFAGYWRYLASLRRHRYAEHAAIIQLTSAFGRSLSDDAAFSRVPDQDPAKPHPAVV